MPNHIDVAIGHKLWTEQDRDLYNKLDVYLAKKMVKQMPVWDTFGRMLKPRKWQANAGVTMKGVSKEPSPVLRSSFYPATLQQTPKRDILVTRENSQSAAPHIHRFESEYIHVVPSFQDFLKDHIDFASQDLTQKIMIAADQFYRTYILECSPEIWVAGRSGGELVSVDHMNTGDTTLVNRKTAGVLAALIADVGSSLTLSQLHKLSTVMNTDLDVMPFEGSYSNEKDEGLKGKFCATVSSEVWDNWQHDPFLKDNRKIDLDIVTGKFHGSLWGRWTTQLQRFPIRLDVDGNQIAPQTVELNPDSPEYGEVKVAPAYRAAPYEIAFACGDGGYEKIDIGPPPSAFAKGDAGVAKLRNLNWNGEVRLTKDLSVPVVNEAGDTVMDTNKYGHYAQLISELTLGCLPTRRRSWVPIIFKRARLGTTLA